MSASLDRLFSEGIAHHQKGDYAACEKACRQLLQKAPKHAGAMNLMGLVELSLERHASAERWIRKAIALDPGNPDFHSNLGETLRCLKRLDEAIPLLERFAAKHPESPSLWHNLGFALHDAKRYEESAEAVRKSLRLQPSLQGFFVLGKSLCKLKQHVEAEKVARKALMLDPGHAEVLALLGDVYYHTDRHQQAIDAYAAAAARNPKLAQTYAMRGLICQKLGQGPRAVAFYRQAMEAAPTGHAWRSSHLLNLLYQDDWTPDAVFAEHRKWDELHGKPSQAFVHAQRRSGARIRVGYVSEDFRDHAVAHFFESLARHHDHGGFEVFCYSDVEKPDSVTQRLQGYADHWRPIKGKTNDQVAKLVHQDQIDILVDLGGHTGGGRRLPVFADRPAPVQVTWAGYPATTGMKAMDARIVDAVTDPEGAERWHTERLVRLPGCFLCYTPPPEAPEVAPPPCLANGFVTFASFNNPAKLTSSWFEWTSRVLNQVPGSRCLVKSVFFGANDGSEGRIRAAFAAHGIGGERITVLPRDQGTAAHLARYHEADIVLDAFPYHGTTTTCDALWMGVPVVTLAGETHVSRVGASLLAAAGLPGCVATTPEAFVAAAVGLAGDPRKLADMRKSMRENMSGLTDGEAFARKMEQAYRQLAAPPPA